MNAAIRAATRLAPRAARQSALANSKAFAPGEFEARGKEKERYLVENVSLP